uniref:Uncharacterized protein n=1 Tax=Peronospora matthiolae TaxID=2874970 RepID=A0AAV1VNI7_9STRA
MNGMTVSWTVKKQGVEKFSTMEAQYVVASEQARKPLDIREMLCKIRKLPVLPMPLHVDNQAALKQLAGEESSLKRSTSTSASNSSATTPDVVQSRPITATGVNMQSHGLGGALEKSVLNKGVIASTIAGEAR